MRKEKVEIKDNGEEMPEICHKTSYKKVSVPLLERIGIKVLRCNKCKKITNIVLDDGNEFCECETGFKTPEHKSEEYIKKSYLLECMRELNEEIDIIKDNKINTIPICVIEKLIDKYMGVVRGKQNVRKQ